jgi:hypothetical protein
VTAIDATTGKSRFWSPGANERVLSLALKRFEALPRRVLQRDRSAAAGLPRCSIGCADHDRRHADKRWHDGPVTVTLPGSLLEGFSSARLTRAEQLDIVGSGIAATADDGGLVVTFDLRGAVPGVWDVVVQTPTRIP